MAFLTLNVSYALQRKSYKVVKCISYNVKCSNDIVFFGGLLVFKGNKTWRKTYVLSSVGWFAYCK